MIAIIKYNAGNIRSVRNALQRLGYETAITDDRKTIKKADKVIFPGVGHASSAMKYLKEKSLDIFIKNLDMPVLGICLGQQLMCSYSEEGNTNCIGVFKASVKKFPAVDIVPHMGWNNINNLKGKIFKSVKTGEDVYFVHSYFVEICDETIADCDYIIPFSAAMQKDNFFATQFHPEKSADVGELILGNFLRL